MRASRDRFFGKIFLAPRRQVTGRAGPSVRRTAPSRGIGVSVTTIDFSFSRGSHPMGCLGVGLVALLALGPTLWVEDDSGDKQRRTAREQLEEIAKKHDATTPGEQYRALSREYDEAREGYERALREAKSDEERQRVFEQSRVGPEHYTHLFQLLARLHPKDPAAIDARVWIGSHDPAGPEGHEAMKILARDHIGSDKLGPVCDAVGRSADRAGRVLPPYGRGEEPPSRGAGASRLRPGPDPQAVVR